jgi:predicted RNA-binding Zn ribbon-like protein
MVRVPRSKQTLGQGRTTDFPRLLGERLCLHFANTVEGPLAEGPEDFLRSYADLARWSWHAGAIDEGDADRLVELAVSRPAQAEAVFARAIRLREAIRRVFGAIARGDAPAERDLARLRREYAAGVAEAELAPRDGAFEWTWDGRRADLRRPLSLVAASAVELLTAGDLRRVKQCPGAGDCGWLFYDTSKAGTRRWCSMEGCGSRVKMRRHYARRRARG